MVCQVVREQTGVVKKGEYECKWPKGLRGPVCLELGSVELKELSGLVLVLGPPAALC